jgi:hypothetical protein
MKNRDLLKLLAFCFLFFAGTTLVNAQNRGNGNQQVTKPDVQTADQQKIDYMNNHLPINTELQKKSDLQSQRGYLDIPGFNFTGDKAVDDANYLVAKQNWVQNNPTQYQDLINQSVLVAPANALPATVSPVAAPTN